MSNGDKRQYPHLRPKLGNFAALLRVRSELTHQIHNFFRENDFTLIHTPALTGNDCEGAGEVFCIKAGPENEQFFDRQLYLSVSGQLHLEATCNGIGKVYNFAPAFRADRSKSQRHLCEFLMVEAEMAFYDMDNLCYFIQSMLKTIITRALENCQEDMFIYNYSQTNQLVLNQINSVLNNDFKTVSYKEAIDILKQQSFKTQPEFGRSLAKEHEFYLVEKHFNNTPVFIIDWPKQTKPFYARTKEDGNVDAVDLLLPSVAEICGGALREHRHNVLLKNMEEFKVDRDCMNWYLELRTSGSAPTAGFGLGFDRLVQFILGISNIRDSLPFPRTAYNCLL